MLVLKHYFASLSTSQFVTFIKNLGRFFSTLSDSDIDNVIKVVTQNIEKRIDIIKRTVYVNNPYQHQNKQINTIRTDIRQIQRDCKKDKQRKITKKMLVGYVFYTFYLNFDNFVVWHTHIPPQSKRSKGNQHQQSDHID